jgi:hypothetical protein
LTYTLWWRYKTQETGSCRKSRTNHLTVRFDRIVIGICVGRWRYTQILPIILTKGFVPLVKQSSKWCPGDWPSSKTQNCCYFRGISSVGRAFALQAKCHRFDPGILHQICQCRFANSNGYHRRHIISCGEVRFLS